MMKNRKKIKKVSELKNGDLVICKKYNELRGTEEPVVLHNRDRGFNTLIAGPTSSFKHNRAIKLYIKQDLQNHSSGVIVLDSRGDTDQEVLEYAKSKNRKDIVYFNPLDRDSVFFNPLRGDLSDVTDRIVEAYKMLSVGESQYFLDNGEILLYNAIRVIKTLYRDNATMADLSNIVSNKSKGLKMVAELTNEDNKYDESTSFLIDEAIDFFSNQYYQTKLFDHCSGVRNILTKLMLNKHFRRIVTPYNAFTEETRDILDFDDIINNGKVAIINTEQGSLREAGVFLNYMMIFSLQKAIYRRNRGNNENKQVYIYAPDYIDFVNRDSVLVLGTNKGYKVAWTIGLSGINQLSDVELGYKLRKSDTEALLANMRNKIIFPGLDVESAKFFAEEIFVDGKQMHGYDEIKYMEPNEAIYHIANDNTLISGKFNSDENLDFKI